MVPYWNQAAEDQETQNQLPASATCLYTMWIWSIGEMCPKCVMGIEMTVLSYPYNWEGVKVAVDSAPA